MTRDQVLDAVFAKLSGTVPAGHVERVLDALAEVAGEELRRRGIFVVPRVVRLKTVKTPATRERRGINPFTREEMVFPGKPAGFKVKAAADAALRRFLDPAADDGGDDDEG